MYTYNIYNYRSILTSIYISRIFKRFRDMGNPGTVPRSMTPQQASTLRIPLSCLTRIPELKVLRLIFSHLYNVESVFSLNFPP